LVILWAILISALHGLIAAFGAFAGSLILITLSRWPLKNLIKRLYAVNFFMAFMWLMIPFSFSTPGEVIARLGPLAVTLEGVKLASLITLKANAIVISIIALLGTTPLHHLAAASREMHIPEKLVGVFLLAVRYFQVMHQEYLRLRRAMRARGFKFNLSSNALRGAANLVGSLVVRSFDRAERVHKAMLSRGYTGMVHVRSAFYLKPIDLVLALIILALAGLVGGLEWRL
jgi:cobalt/nickel transport system permease protein